MSLDHIGSSEPRTYLAEMLDAIRRQQEQLNVNRARYLVLARHYGMSIGEIAEYVGMSSSGVRKAIGRVKSSPPSIPEVS